MSKCVCRFWPLVQLNGCAFNLKPSTSIFRYACKFGSGVLLNASMRVYEQTIDIGHITFFVALSDHPNKRNRSLWNATRTRLGIAGVIHAVLVSLSSASQKCLSELGSFQLMFYICIFLHVSVFCNRSLFLNISLSGISQDNDVLRRESEGTRARALLSLSSVPWVVQPLSTWRGMKFSVLDMTTCSQVEDLPTFRRNMLLPSLRLKNDVQHCRWKGHVPLKLRWTLPDCPTSHPRRQ
jgi:hypothetical protein